MEQKHGHAAKFYDKRDHGAQYFLFDNCVGRIAPTAFDRAIGEKQNVIPCFNHEEAQTFARTQDGSCRLNVDTVGLRYE